MSHIDNHSDSPHQDALGCNTAHSDFHKDIHGDGGGDHFDKHSDIAHCDSPHDDVTHGDNHGDVV